MRVNLRMLSGLRHGLLMGMMAVFSLPAAAETQSTLKLPVKSELLVLDGQSAKELSLPKGGPISLSRKRHQVVFELSDTFGNGSNLERFTSRPFILTFHPVAGNKYIIAAPRLINRRQAESINANPASKITLVDAKGNEVPFEMAILPSRGFQFGRNLATDVQKFNLTENEAAAPEFSGVQGIAAGVITTLADSEENSEEENAMADKMLKYWFNAAGNDTRKTFLNWANEEMAK